MRDTDRLLTPTPDVQATVQEAVQGTQQSAPATVAVVPKVSTPTVAPPAVAVPSPLPAASPRPSPAIATEPAMQSFRGRGITPRGEFDPETIVKLESGLALFRITAGRGAFVFTLSNMDNSPIVSEGSGGSRMSPNPSGSEGPYEGVIAVSVPRSDSYSMVIIAESPWGVSVEQPRPIVASDVPISLSGKGDRVSPFFMLRPGTTTFRVQAAPSDEAVTAELLNAQGERISLLAVGQAGLSLDETEDVEVAEEGIYVLAVQSSGPWMVTSKIPTRSRSI
jgi:hypothetical protein